MRLLTHNMLCSNIKGVETGFPLVLHVQHVERIEAARNLAFLQRIFPKLHWPALKQAAEACGESELPQELPLELDESDGQIVHMLHRLLLELHVSEGNLECPDTGRLFPISSGIPNMLLNEDEC